MDDNLGGGGWNPAHFQPQWSPDQFGSGDLGFPPQEPTQYPGFDGLYNEQPETLAPSQSWPQTQGDFYTDHSGGISGFGFTQDPDASYPPPQQQQQPLSDTWQQFQPQVQNGYTSAEQYGNALAPQTGSPTPYPQQVRFMPAEPVQIQNRVPGTAVSHQPNGYAVGNLQAVQPPQQVPRQQILAQQQTPMQHMSPQHMNQSQVPQHQISQHDASQHQRPQHQGPQHQGLQPQLSQQQLAQQQIQQQQFRQQQIHQQQIHQQVHQQQSQQQPVHFAPSPSKAAVSSSPAAKETARQRVAAARSVANIAAPTVSSVSASSEAPRSSPVPVPHVSRPASVPAATPPIIPAAAAPKPSPVPRPATVPPAATAAIPITTPIALPASVTTAVQTFVTSSSNDISIPTIREETDIRKEAESRKQTWPGVPNLVIREAEVQLPRPAMRYTTTILKGNKCLFKGLPGGPILGEVLGRHMEAYLNIPLGPEHDDTRRRIDAIMDVELRRIQKTNERPKDWYSRAIPGEGRKREISGWENYSAKNNDNKPDHQRIDSPPTEDMVTAAEVFLPLERGNNRAYIKKLDAEFAERIRGVWKSLRENPACKELTSMLRQRKRDANSVSDDEIAKLRDKLREPKEKLFKLIASGLNVKDDTAIRELGSRTQAMASVFNALTTLVNQDEVASPLGKAVLQLLCRISNITPSDLENLYKFDEGKQKLIREKGDDETSRLLGKFIAAVEKNKDKDIEPRKQPKQAVVSKLDKTTGSPSKKLEAAGVRSFSGAKRLREDENEPRTSKKLATGPKSSPSPAPLSAPTKPPTVLTKAATSTSLAAKLASKKSSVPPAAATAKPAAGVLPGKRAPAKPIPKSDLSISDAGSHFSKAEMATKVDFSKLEITKPGTKPVLPSSSSSASATKSTMPKKATAAGPPAKSAFSSLLDEINEPKPDKRREPTPTKDPSKPETEQERARRLRKQERRRLNLHVTFKSDDCLVQVREFHREEGEEVGNFMTNGIDMKSEGKTDEGRALKESHISDIRPYDDLILVDFSPIPSPLERGDAYTTRGGQKTFRTAEQDFMEDRDMKVLSVVYTSKEDIPPSPRSPILDYSEPKATGHVWPLPSGAPQLDEATRRLKDANQHGLHKALRNAEARVANPVFGTYQNVMENVEAVIRQNTVLSGQPIPQPAAQSTAQHATGPAPAPSSSLTDPNRRPVDIHNLQAYLNTFKGVDWDAPGMCEVRGNATVEILQTIPCDILPKPLTEIPVENKTHRRHDYPDPKVQEAADAVENFVAQFVKEHPVHPVQVPKKSEPQHLIPNQQQLFGAAPLQSAVSASQEDYTQAWVRYFQDNPQAASAMWQQQHQQPGQSMPAQNAQQTYQHVAGQPINQPAAQVSYQQPAVTYYTQPQPSNNEYADFQAIIAQLQQSGQQQAAPAVPVDSGTMQRSTSLDGYGSYNEYDPYQSGPRNQENDSYDGYSGSATQGNGNSQGGNRNNQAAKHGRKHAREDQGVASRQGNNAQNNNKRNRTSTGSTGHEDSDDHEPARNINPNKIGTKQCSFWLKGKCAKGDRCTYRHQ